MNTVKMFVKSCQNLWCEKSSYVQHRKATLLWLGVGFLLLLLRHRREEKKKKNIWQTLHVSSLEEACMIKTIGLNPKLEKQNGRFSVILTVPMSPIVFLLHSFRSCGHIDEQYDEQDNHRYSGQHHSGHLLPGLLHGLLALLLVLRRLFLGFSLELPHRGAVCGGWQCLKGTCCSSTRRGNSSTGR